MIEILKDELRIDETVLRYGTPEELQQIDSIARTIVARARSAEEGKDTGDD